MADEIENILNDIYKGNLEVKKHIDYDIFGLIIGKYYMINLDYVFIHIKVMYRYNEELTLERNIDYICNEIDKIILKKFKY